MRWPEMAPALQQEIERTIAEVMARGGDEVAVREGVYRRHGWRPTAKFVERKCKTGRIVRLVAAIEEARGLGPVRERTLTSERELLEWAGDHSNALTELARLATDPATEPRIKISALKEIRETRAANRSDDLEAFRMEVELLVREIQHQRPGLDRAVILEQLLPEIECVDKSLKDKFLLELKLAQMRSQTPTSTPSLLVESNSE